MRDWLFLFGGLLLTIAYDISKPWILAYFRKGSLSFNNWRIKLTKERYSSIKAYNNNHSTLVARSIQHLVKVLINILILFGFIGVLILSRFDSQTSASGLGSILIGVFGGLIVSDLLDIVQVIDNAMEFDKYKDKTEARIKKLGGNPEDLDKEEIEVIEPVIIEKKSKKAKIGG